MSDYLAEKLEHLQIVVKNLTAVQSYTAPGGKLQRVDNNVFEYLSKMQIWKQDELAVALESGHFQRSVEHMVGLFDNELGMIPDTHPDYIAFTTLREVILEAAPLTATTASQLTAANQKFCERQERRRASPCRNGCRCEISSLDDSEEPDFSSDEALAAALDELPLVRELVREFGGNPYKQPAKSAKTDAE